MDYKDDASVEGEAYCMPSMEKRNVDGMNMKMGYHDMSDRANTAKMPTPVRAQVSNKQVGPEMNRRNK
jgi:hypothetical protein